MTTATIIPSLTNTPPSRANPAAFPTDGDSFLNDLPDVVSGVNTVANELNTWNAEVETFKNQANSSQTNAANSSTTSLTQARNAAASMVSLWVSGTTYPTGQIVYSNVDGREYKRITAGAGTTDPSLDTTNWEPLGWEYITNYPDIRPTLDLNFAGSQTVDPRITFTRNSTATYFDKFGVMQTAAVNQPRIDFDPVTGECKGLLIEEQRTNLLTYSEQFDNAVWTKENVSVSANALISPDGVQSADLVVVGSSSNRHKVGVYLSPPSATWVFSIYVKSAGVRFVALNETAQSGASSSILDLSTGATAAATGSVGTTAVSNVGNGWYRLSWSFTVNTSVHAFMVVPLNTLAAGTNPNSYTWTGDGTSGIYIWGAQLEAGSFPTSYIPTTTAQATRARDGVIMTGDSFSSWYRVDEGAVFVESIPQSGSYLYVDAHSSVTADIVRTLHTPTSAQPATLVAGAATSSFNITGLAAPIKSAFAYKLNDFAASANGGAVQTDTSGNLPTEVNRLTIGQNNYSPTGHCGHIKRITHYPKRLPNQVLQAITQP